MAEEKKERKVKFKYFQLGEKANTFSDPKSGLFIVNDEVKKIDARKIRASLPIRQAIEGGHIKEVDEADHEKYESRKRPAKKEKEEDVKEVVSTDGEKVKVKTSKKKKKK